MGCAGSAQMEKENQRENELTKVNLENNHENGVH